MAGPTRKVNIETSVPLLPEEWLANCKRYSMSTEAATLCVLFERAALDRGNPFLIDGLSELIDWIIQGSKEKTKKYQASYDRLKAIGLISWREVSCPDKRTGCRHFEVTLTLRRGA